MFPDYYPVREHPISLLHDNALAEDDKDYWASDAKSLKARFRREIEPLIKEDPVKHFSLFAFAPMPLLILLGTLFTDKVKVTVYQRHRCTQSWKWRDKPDGFRLELRQSSNPSGTPVLILSLSASISHDRIKAVLGAHLSQSLKARSK